MVKIKKLKFVCVCVCDTVMDMSEEEMRPLMTCECSGSHKSSCDSFMTVHLYYSTTSKSESMLSIPAGHVTAESICVLAAKNCGNTHTVYIQ